MASFPFARAGFHCICFTRLMQNLSFVIVPLKTGCDFWRDVTLHEDHSQIRTAGKPEVLAALNDGVLALMDWLGVPNVPDQMRVFATFPTLALQLLLGPLTFE